MRQPAQPPIAPPADLPVPDYERPAMSGEAPAEFALIDEFAETPDEPAAEAIAPEPIVRTGPATAATARDACRRSFARRSAGGHRARGDRRSSRRTAVIVEAEADEPAPAAAAEPPAVNEAPVPPSVSAPPVKAPPWLDEPAPHPRRHPLRFMWQMDAEGRFALGSDEFTRLIGARTAAGFGRLWSEIAETFGLDPDGRVLKAIATRHTWSGIVLNWPVDGGSHLPVELSGLPIYDRARNFAGYRGFGVCRDLDGLARLDALRRHEFLHHECFNAAPTPDAVSHPAAAADLAEPSSPAAEPPAVSDAVASAAAVESSAPASPETSKQTDLETPVETPNEVLKNVVPFRPISEPRAPVLTPVENSAFNELARQLSARLESENGAPAAADTAAAPEPVAEPPAATETPGQIAEQPGWLTRPEPPPRGETRRDRMLLDLLPVGVLIYRLDRLLHANPAFLQRIGYPSLHLLEQAGGIDALYVEPGVSSASSTSDTGTPVTISAPQAPSEHAAAPAIEARLYTIGWDDDSALALIFSGAGAAGAGLESASVAAAIGPPCPRRSHPPSATPMPRNSAPSSTPRPKAL